MRQNIFYHTQRPAGSGKGFGRASRRRQAGVTLLLGILILSSVMAISFSLATVLFVETRSSGDIVRSEPSFYGANSVSEEALFNVQRHTGVTTYSSSVGQVKLSSAPTTLQDAVQQVKVTPASNSFAGSQNVYPIYNPAAPTGASGYGGIRVTFLNTGILDTYARLHVYLCEFDPTDPNADCSSLTNPSGQQNPYLVYPDITPLAQGQCWPSASPPCSATFTLYGDSVNKKQQQLVLFSSGTTATEYVNIETFDTAGKPQGIPYFGQTAVDVAASNSSVTRNVRVVIPNTSSNASASISFVQGTVAAAYASLPYTMSFGSGVTAGNKIIVGIAWSYSGCPPSISDSQGNVYTRVGSINSLSEYMYWFTAPISTNGPDALTVNAACGTSVFSFASEYSGLSAASYDNNTSQANTSSPCSAGSLSTGTGGELIMGVFVDSAGRSFTAGSGFTQRGVNGVNAIVEDQVQSSSGAISATAGCSANSTYGSDGFMAAFK